MGASDYHSAASFSRISGSVRGPAPVERHCCLRRLENGDINGRYAAVCDPYRMAAEALLAREGLRATGGGGSQ